MTGNDDKPLFGKRPGAARPPGAVNSLRPRDKRRGERATVFKNAKIIFSNRTELDCIVRNYSAIGCLVSLIGAENLPDRLSVRVDVLGQARPGHVVWREQGVAGVEFVDPPAVAPTPAAPTGAKPG